MTQGETVLDGVEGVHETGVFDLDPVWTVTAAVGIVLFDRGTRPVPRGI